MKVETITAPTMPEALQLVKQRLGSNAVIIRTRTLTQRRWLGLRRTQIIEVTAGDGAALPPRRVPAPRKPVQGSVPTSASAVAAQRAYGRGTVETDQPTRNRLPSTPTTLNPTNSPSRPGAKLMESPAVASVAMLNFAKEIDGLKTMVNSLVTEVRSRGSPSVPEELFDHYQKLIQSEVAEEIAVDILRTVQRNARPEQLNNAIWVRERIVEQIERLIPTAGPIERRRVNGPHIVALIGPTGVGKTTTVAKLAANLKLREKKSVGLITIDTYRIAAIDQLRRYADLIGVRLEVVGSPEELPEAIAALGPVDHVLIDTAGRSPNDTLKLNELGRFLELAEPDEVHLVLSSTCGGRATELAIERFGQLRVDKVLLTKLDEAAQMGTVLSAVRRINKGLSYITTGQDVPDDIEVGTARRIARLILGEGN